MGVHFFFVAAIATFLFFQFQKNTGLPTFLIVVIGVGLGVLFAYALFRSAFLKNLMDILIAAPIVVLVMFVFFSNANKLIFPDSDKVELASNPSADTPVVLVIFDELGTNGLMTDTKTVDARRYPNFAKLEKTSTWYKDQSTTAFFTPRAVPGILTGVIIGMARAIGETAPIITIGALTFIAFLPPAPFTGEPPAGLFDWVFAPFTVMPIQIFNWTSRPDPAFEVNAAAAAFVLMVMVLSMNAVAIYLRYTMRKKIKW